MDIAAHALWVGVGIAIIHRHRRISPRIAAATLALAVLPDLAHLLPMIAWNVFGDGSLAQLWRYSVALPGQEPDVPATIAWLTHHLHCIFHSAIVAAVVSLIAWRIWRKQWLPLLGWWSHILIDIPTHSADFYPSPVLYPITQRGFDGLAWNTPWFVAVNYTALVVSGLYLLWTYRRHLKKH